MLWKDFLPLACLHQIITDNGAPGRAAFSTSLSPTSATEVLLFKRFQQQWSYIDQNQYSDSVSDRCWSGWDSLHSETWNDGVCAQAVIRESVRDDYREFTELSIVFLGGLPARAIHFMAPGAMHHARWLSKVIYSLKVWMFRSQFNLTSFEPKGLRKICIFAVVIDLQAWFTTSIAACAPHL